MNPKKIAIVIAVFLFASLSTYFGQKYYDHIQIQAKQKARQEAVNASRQKLKDNILSEIRLFQGDVAFVIKDLNSNWELNHQKDKPFASASLAKTPLMAALLMAAEKGKVDLEKSIYLKSSDKLEGSGYLQDLPNGQSFKIGRLVGLMIYESDNTATNILTNLLGLSYYQKMFKDLGLAHTTLDRKIADYDARDRKGIENYTTAGDMALILEKIYRGQVSNRKVSDQCISMLKLTRLNDRIAKYLPANLTVAHKTGLENGICHDAGIVYTPKGDLVVVVLTKHPNETSALSKELIAKVALHAYQYLTS